MSVFFSFWHLFLLYFRYVFLFLIIIIIFCCLIYWLLLKFYCGFDFIISLSLFFNLRFDYILLFFPPVHPAIMNFILVIRIIFSFIFWLSFILQAANTFANESSFENSFDFLEMNSITRLWYNHLKSVLVSKH